MKQLTMMFAPYMVIADWGQTRVHFAWSRKEAMAWMKAYPCNARVSVTNVLTNYQVERRAA